MNQPINWTTKAAWGACIMAGVFIAACFSGCATFSTAAKDRDAIRAVLHAWKTAYENGNHDALMALYTDDCHFKDNGRDAMAKALKEMIEEGKPYETKAIVDYADIIIHGDKATVIPVALCGRGGSDTVRFEFSKQNGKWLISLMDEK